ncbi:MAG: hypothetical protein QM484_01445 [Woeseiaceae bacterium]
MKKYILVFALMFVGTANATVVDFESGFDPIFNYSVVSVLAPTAPHALSGYQTVADYTNSTQVAYNGSAQSPSTFSWASAGTFDLNSFVIAGAWGSQTLTIEGLLNGVSIFDSLLAVTNDAVSVFSANWSGIDAFRITIGTDFVQTANLGGSGQHWAIDDIAVNETVSAVPVPAAAWLFGSALLGFFGFSRKKATVA